MTGRFWAAKRVSRDILEYRPEVFLQRARAALREAGWLEHGRVRLDVQLATWSGRPMSG